MIMRGWKVARVQEKHRNTRGSCEALVQGIRLQKHWDEGGVGMMVQGSEVHEVEQMVQKQLGLHNVVRLASRIWGTALKSRFQEMKKMTMSTSRTWWHGTM